MKHQFLTANDHNDGYRIQSDLVIDDDNDYQLRRDKYFGEKSMLRMIHQEENIKLD